MNNSSILELQVQACTLEDLESSANKDIGSMKTQDSTEEGAALDYRQGEHIECLPSMVLGPYLSEPEVPLVPATVYKSSAELSSTSPELSWRVPHRQCSEVLPAAPSNKRLRKEASPQTRGRGIK